MLGRSKAVAVGMAAGVVLLAGTAGAQTTTTIKATTTTTSTTTTTTLQPHPFSPATASCVRQARAALRACRLGGGGSCLTPYQTAFANCFAPNTGVTCATRCNTRENTCFAAAPALKKTCRAACATTRKADVKACKRIADGDNIWASGDGGCLTTAQSNFLLCRIVCAEAEDDCRTAFTFCIADCPNL